MQFVVAAAPGRSGLLQQGWPHGLDVRVIEGQTYDTLAHADISIVSSGTATVEAALLDAPMVVVYRVSPVTAILAEALVRTRFFSMVNLIAGREVLPELIQKDFTPEKVAAEALRLLRDSQSPQPCVRSLPKFAANLPRGPSRRCGRNLRIVDHPVWQRFFTRCYPMREPCSRPQRKWNRWPFAKLSRPVPASSAQCCFPVR